MPSFLSFLLLLSIFFIYYVASSSLPETFNTSHLLNAQATCTGFKLFQLRPLYRDCDRAVDFLSSSRLPGNFHSGSPMDMWQLPVTETVDTCELRLQLAPLSLPEPGSWKEIKGAARRLNEDCRNKAALGDVTGGAVTAGVHDRIQISMVRKASGGEDVTDVA